MTPSRSARPTRADRLAGTALLVALLAAACGDDDRHRTGPDKTPTPTPPACSPQPPPLARLNVRLYSRDRAYWTLDAKPIVGPDHLYCAWLGYQDGRSYCEVRRDDDPMREACEFYAVGRAADTGRIGPTWTRNGQHCTSVATGCQNSPDTQYHVWANGGGTYRATATNGAFGQLVVDR